LASDEGMNDGKPQCNWPRQIGLLRMWSMLNATDRGAARKRVRFRSKQDWCTEEKLHLLDTMTFKTVHLG
jgi:hypothetical protein